MLSCEDSIELMLQYFCLVSVIVLDRTHITRITKEWCHPGFNSSILLASFAMFIIIIFISINN